MCNKRSTFYHSGGNGKRVPPVLIPNTVVKPLCADGTWPVTARENKSSPDTINSSLAQSVEHAAVNRSVARSSRAGGATKKGCNNMQPFFDYIFRKK